MTKSDLYRALILITAVGPSFVYLVILLMQSENFSSFAPFFLYLVVSLVAILLGYRMMRDSFREEERKRIAAIVEDVLAKRALPPSDDDYGVGVMGSLGYLKYKDPKTGDTLWLHPGDYRFKEQNS